MKEYQLKDLAGESGIFIDGDWVESKDQDIHGYIRLIQLADIGVNSFKNVSRRFMNEEVFNRLKCTKLEEGDILVSRMPDPIGRACIFDLKEQKCATVVDVSILRPDSVNFYNRWIMYKINSFSFQKAVQKHVTGTTRKRISRTNLGNIKFHVPPLSEQKRIVAILDKAQQLIDLRRQQLTKLDELIQSIFYDMFGDPVTNPKGWEVKKLGEVSSLTTKGSSPKWQGFDYQSQGIRFITSENVLLGKLDVSKDKFIPEEFHDKLSRSKLAENDLLINLVGASIGRSCLMTKDALPANINQAVSLTRLSVDLTNPLYVLYLLITQPMQDELCGNKVEGARANISLKNVRELKIIFPPLELQNQFASKVEKIEEQKKVMQQSLAKLEENFKALQQRAFRGHL